VIAGSTYIWMAKNHKKPMISCRPGDDMSIGLHLDVNGGRPYCICSVPGIAYGRTNLFRESPLKVGNLLEVLLFVFGLREISIKSKVIIYLNDVPWMHP